MFKSIPVEEMEVKVVLPEGVRDISVSVPYESKVTTSVNGTRLTYLDSTFTGGRRVVVLKAKNIVEEHSAQVVLTYSFSSSRMVLEPLMIVVVLLGAFVLTSVVMRGDVNVSKKEAKEAKEERAEDKKKDE